MKTLKKGDKVRIERGHTLGGGDCQRPDTVEVDCAGMTGTVDDSNAYENRRGEQMVEVDLDSEHGGGKTFVPRKQLSSGRKSFFFGGWRK